MIKFVSANKSVERNNIEILPMKLFSEIKVPYKGALIAEEYSKIKLPSLNYFDNLYKIAL